MSRIGKAPITVPSGVDVTIAGADVTVKGPKGELSRTIPEAISVSTRTATRSRSSAPTTSVRSVPCTA